MPFGGHAPLPIRLGGTAEEGWTAQQHARLCADLVALKRVQPLAAWSFFQSDTTPFPVTMRYYYGMNGAGLAYAPTATVNGEGDVDFQWDSAYFEDEYERQYPWKITIAHGTCGVTDLGYSGLAAAVVVSQIVRGVNVRWGSNGAYTQGGTVSVRVW